MERETFDVIIVGGSYSGLSAALALGRSLRRVLIIDGGEPCNAPTPHSHNFLTQDGRTPKEISALSTEQVLKYPTVVFKRDFAVSAKKEDDGFIMDTKSGQRYQSSILLLATGIKDIFPEIPGVKECWGKSVLHCPYCHGYEVRGQKLGIVSNGEHALEYVKLILNWSKDLVLMTNGEPQLTNDARKFLQSMNVPIVADAVKEIVHVNGQLERVRFENNDSLQLDAAFMRLPFTHHSDIAKQLGCTLTEMNHIAINDFGETSVKDVYAAGDCTTPWRSVSIAVASGTKAGAAINKYLIDEKDYAAMIRV